MAVNTSTAISSPSRAEAAVRFRELLPRIYELKDMLGDPSHPDAYFQDFEDGLETIPTKLSAFQKLERHLAALDDAAWSDLKERAGGQLVSQTRGKGRGWQSLFDIFNEARAFGHLVGIGCTGVHFIRRTTHKTPDLGASLDGRPLFCEVKTINMSADEAGKRQRIHEGEFVATSVSPVLDEGFLRKLTSTLEHAVGQLDATDPERKARRLVFAVLHFDDWVGDYQGEYLAQIDEHLLRRPVEGAEFVFCLASNLFERTFTMTSATLLSE